MDLAEGGKVDEAITTDMEIDLKEELKTESYKETMNIYIENINIFEKKRKVYTTQWRTIYEVIHQFFDETDIFLEDLITKCKNN